MRGIGQPIRALEAGQGPWETEPVKCGDHESKRRRRKRKKEKGKRKKEKICWLLAGQLAPHMSDYRNSHSAINLRHNFPSYFQDEFHSTVISKTIDYVTFLFVRIACWVTGSCPWIL
jgi:hypothetical protein